LLKKRDAPIMKIHAMIYMGSDIKIIVANSAKEG